MKHVARCGLVALAFQFGVIPSAGAEVMSRGAVEALIREAWAGTGQADRAVAVARCESRLSPTARNRHSTATGVFQLIRAHWRGRFDPTDARANVAAARRLWARSGWRPWVCARRR